MIRMNFDRTGNSDEVRLEIDQNFAQPLLERVSFLREVTISKAKKLRRRAAEECEGQL